jgi:hypothetical protein
MAFSNVDKGYLEMLAAAIALHRSRFANERTQEASSMKKAATPTFAGLTDNKFTNPMGISQTHLFGIWKKGD